MKVVVYPHMLEIGGSQLNAIELAAAIRDEGHEVIVFSQPGPLERRIGELGLEFVAAPRPRGRPSLPVMHALDRLARRRRIDVVHGYEWTTSLEAYWGPRGISGIPAVATVMSMAVAPFLPRDMPLIVGTEQIADHERRAGRADVAVIEPPVDLEHNAPGVVDTAAFRADHGIVDDALTVVCVTRLAAELKTEGVLAAIDVVADLGDETRAQFVLVGDGPTRDAVETAAAAANTRCGRRAIILTGQLDDPRAAYATADVCLGMGGSALRAMAFGRPVVVQGEAGYWELLTPDTVEAFLWAGWYGVGDGAQHGPARLRSILGPLLADPTRRAELGRYALGLVEERFSLRRAGARQLELYERTLRAGPLRRRQSIAAAGASASGLTAYRVRRRVEHLFGRASADDFNAVPVAKLSR